MTISASTRLRVVVLLTSVALALALLLSGAVVAGASAGTGSETIVATFQQEVRPGDTLWAIATAYTNPGRDVRDMIHDIRAANGLESSNIVIGQVLVIPVEFE